VLILRHQKKMPRCRCGADSVHQHLLESEVNPSMGVVVNDAIQRSAIQWWNFEVIPAGGAAADVFDVSDEATAAVTSDVDSELLVHLRFAQVVHIRGISVLNKGHVALSPLQLRLFVNPPSFNGFSDAERGAPSQVLQLAPALDPQDRVVHATDAAKFRRVTNLAFYFKDSIGQVKSRIDKIVIYGEPTEELVDRKMAANVVYELRPNPADHPRVYEEEGAAVLRL
jgi:hypothetical protein